MKTVLKVLYYISIAIYMCSGAFFIVLEFMPDVSVIPETVRKTVLIIGLIFLAYAIVYYAVQQRKKTLKPKMRR